MSIIGDHPEGGVRFDLARRTTTSPWVYAGSLATPGGKHDIVVTVDAAGAASVESQGSLSPELCTRAKLLVRTVVKHATAGTAPPLRIRRWRSG
jgi:hypothetical protein